MVPAMPPNEPHEPPGSRQPAAPVTPASVEARRQAIGACDDCGSIGFISKGVSTAFCGSELMPSRQHCAFPFESVSGDERDDEHKAHQDRAASAYDPDRKSTRLKSSHLGISYAVF